MICNGLVNGWRTVFRFCWTSTACLGPQVFSFAPTWAKGCPETNANWKRQVQPLFLQLNPPAFNKHSIVHQADPGNTISLCNAALYKSKFRHTRAIYTDKHANKRTRKQMKTYKTEHGDKRTFFCFSKTQNDLSRSSFHRKKYIIRSYYKWTPDTCWSQRINI